MSFRTSTTWSATGLSKIAASMVAGTRSATTSSVGSKYLNSFAKGRSDVHEGVVSAATHGAIFGLLGAVAGQGLAAKFATTRGARMAGLHHLADLPPGWTRVEGSVRNKLVVGVGKLVTSIKDASIAPGVKLLPEW